MEENASLKTWSHPPDTEDPQACRTIEYGETPDSQMTVALSEALGVIPLLPTPPYPSLPMAIRPYMPDFSVATGDFTSGDYTNGARLFNTMYIIGLRDHSLPLFAPVPVPPGLKRCHSSPLVKVIPPPT